MKKSPLKQDAKFNTTLYDKNIQNLTSSEKKTFRKSQAKAAGFAASLLPIGRGVKLIGKLGGTFFNTTKQLLSKKKMGPSKETIDYLLKYSKDFGPIIKNMKK